MQYKLFSFSLFKNFEKFINDLWPIKKSESKLVLINAMILFCIIFNYTVLRNLKDTFINTANCSGPEVTCFIKSWLVLPISIICFLSITKVSNLVSRAAIFYLSNSAFLLFFLIFCFYLYPNTDAIHPSIETIKNLQSQYPSLQWVFPIYGIWSYSLFYVMAELWGSIMMSLLFWEYANGVTTTEEARRFYPFFILLANIGLMAAGSFVGSIIANQAGVILNTTDVVTNKITNLANVGNSNLENSIVLANDLANVVNTTDISPNSSNEWYASLQIILVAVVAFGILSMFFYRWATYLIETKNKKLRLHELHNSNINNNNLEASKKLKLNFIDSLKCVFSSKYLGLISILVIAYGAAINLIEVVWKKQLALYFTNPADYCAFMSKFSFYTGVTTIVTILFTKKIIQYSSWLIAAIFTPIMLAITASIFFSALFYRSYFMLAGDNIMLFGASLSLIIIWIGAIQNILSKSSKYALFDPAKEIAYIPLNNELKMKGKAAVDVVGERLGKATGGYIQQILLIVTGGSILSLTPVLFVLIAFIVFGWIIATIKLNAQYNSLVKTQSDISGSGNSDSRNNSNTLHPDNSAEYAHNTK